MKRIDELHKMLRAHAFEKINAHIHTYLCDGKPEMTVRNIATRARETGISLAILTPHFHKQVSDETATLYEDTDEQILLQLREEIDEYHKNSDGKVRFLLSTEADILTIEGETSLKISKAVEDALDLVTPTINYHPLLPLRAVEVTMSKTIEEFYESGLYEAYSKQIGGIPKVLETLYEAEANAILKSKYPAMLGHFFAAHSYAVGKYSWFGAREEDMECMKAGAKKIIDACVKTGAMIDLTGIQQKGLTQEEKEEKDGFFAVFQRWFISECEKANVVICPGSDSHSLGSIGNVSYYRRLKRD